MKLNDLLDTKPFNVFYVALGVFVLTSIIFHVPDTVGRALHDIAPKLQDVKNIISFETLNGQYAEDIFQLIQFPAGQYIAILQ
jgi:hypothetical protein